MNPLFKTIGVIGAGAMGRGIAQIAAQAGSQVLLFDTNPQASSEAVKAVGAQWDKLVAKGRMDAAAAQACQGRLTVPAKQTPVQPAFFRADRILPNSAMPASIPG